MHITIVGAGPAGLLLGYLLRPQYDVTILDKRKRSTRNHVLNIDTETVNIINAYLDNNISIGRSGPDLRDSLTSWCDVPTNISDVESILADTAVAAGVIIKRDINVESLDQIPDRIIIGADGAHSKIREFVFNGETTDQHNVQYMALLKYQTPGATRPRKVISALSYSLLNGLSGPDIVLDFESLAAPNDELRKSGTLHIPIPKIVYDTLSENGRGGYLNPWRLELLNCIVLLHDMILVLNGEMVGWKMQS